MLVPGVLTSWAKLQMKMSTGIDDRTISREDRGGRGKREEGGRVDGRREGWGRRSVGLGGSSPSGYPWTRLLVGECRD